VTAPIAPGVLARVGILEVAPLAIGERRLSTVPTGTVAVDGEREIEFSPDRPVSVTLSGSGPLVVDIPKVMRVAADRDLLISGQAPAEAASAASLGPSLRLDAAGRPCPTMPQSWGVVQRRVSVAWAPELGNRAGRDFEPPTLRISAG
jgi:hypothetical protein